MTTRSDADLYWPLTSDITPQNGTGSPTFTRTTAASVFDNEGKAISVPSGAVRIGGARMVWNFCTNKSEDISVATWLIGGGGSKSGANTFVCANATIKQNITNSQTVNSLVGQVWLATWRVEYVDIRYVQLTGASSGFGSGQYCNFDLLDGDHTAVGCTGTMTPVSSGVWDISILVTATGSVSNAVTYLGLVDSQSALREASFTGDGVKSIKILRFQYENVTGQADQTAGEYVSVGVLPPPYHGAGVDGVKWFTTNKDGSAISDIDGIYKDNTARTNSLLHCRDMTNKTFWVPSVTGAAILTDDGTSIASWVNGSPSGTIATVAGELQVTSNANGGLAYRQLSTEIGTRYRVQMSLRRISGAGLTYFEISTGENTTAMVSSAVSVSSTASIISMTFTATSTAHRLMLVNNLSGMIGGFDNISIYEVGVIATLTGTGIDGSANSCSILECMTANGTILQTITAAAVAASSGFQIKRHTGTGTIEMTRDGGTTWANITHSINSDTFTLCKIENTSVTNPSIGFRMGTIGDKIIVDAGINHSGVTLTPFPIFTTTAAVSVNAETLTIPTTSNISNTIGTILATVKQDTWSSGSVVGSTTTGLFSSDTNSGVQAKDGTNTASGVAGTPTGSQNIGMRWTGSFLQAFSGDEFGVVGSYDGSLNLTTIGIMPGVAGYIKDVAIFQTYLSNAEILSIFGLRLNDIFNNDAAIAFFKANGFPTEYNDGLLAWLKSFYGVENTSWPLADLLARYLREYGTRLPESVLTEFILLEDGSKLLQEDGFRLTLETSGTIPVATLGPYMLLETGDFILQEDNNKFLLEA